MSENPRRAAILAAAAGLVFAATASAQSSCPADLDGDGELTVFDFLEFQNLFDAGDLRADFDGDGELNIFDFLAFQNAFNDGCPEDPISIELASVDLPAFPFADFVETFDEGEAITISIDPSKVTIPSGLVDVYLVEDKTASEWASDPTLTDARGFPQPSNFSGGASTADNQVAQGGVGFLNADAGENIGVPYDVVVDVDGNGELSDGDFIDGLDEVGFWLFKDLTTSGPAATTRVSTYTATFPGIPSSRDEQRLTYPTDIATRDNVPVVIIAHGNGQQYVWYDYMHDHFASHGFVVMSHQNDTVPGIETASETILRHTDYFWGNLDTIAGGVLEGRLDKSNTSWIGHSRGGEGVARAVDKIIDGIYTPVNYSLSDLNFVSSIAPTDFLLTSRSNPHGVNYHHIAGAGDGDVNGGPTSPIVQYFALYERANDGPGDEQRTNTYIHGADHNDFNCCGFNDYTGPAALQIGRAEAQQAAKIIWLVLIQNAARGNEAAMEYMQRQWESTNPEGVRDTTIVDLEFKAAFDLTEKTIIDDFQSQPSANVASSTAAITFNVSNVTEGRIDDGNTSFTWTSSDPMNGMTRGNNGGDQTRGVVFDYNSDRFFEYELPGLPVFTDFTEYEKLSFRVCQGTRHPETTAVTGDQTFTVTLRDSSGGTSSINVGVYGGGAEEPFPRTGAGSGAGWGNEFETIRINIEDFVRDGVALDLENIEAVRFEFGPSFGTPRGRIGFDDLELLK
ncbi:MAG: GC-type dockerin domain-anchored protein [Planctomycetota bacterium]